MIQNFTVITPDTLSSRDLQIVEQIGAIDLREAYATGIVEGSLEGVEGSTNGIEDPSSIIGKPDDVFSLHRASSLYKDAVSSSTASSIGSPDTGAAPTSE